MIISIILNIKHKNIKHPKYYSTSSQPRHELKYLKRGRLGFILLSRNNSIQHYSI